MQYSSENTEPRKKVAFVQTSHLATDERVYFHQREALIAAGCEVLVVSTYSDTTQMSNNEKMKKIGEELTLFSPDVVICDTPLAVFAAKKVRSSIGSSRIIYDITEWYPSEQHLRGLSLLKKWIKAFLLYAANLYAGFLSDGFVFGEYYKSLRFRRLLFWKRHIFTTYYPDLSYFSQVQTKTDFSAWKFLYSGVLSERKGYGRVLSAVKQIAQRHPEKSFVLKVIGNLKDVSLEESALPNLKYEFLDYMPFRSFCEAIAHGDIFLDLRVVRKQEYKSLPIKLFYYMAVGGVSVYTDMRGIRKGVPDHADFMTLVDPDKEDLVVSAIERYVTDEAFYLQQSKYGYSAVHEKYNWDRIKGEFVQFIKYEK